MKNERRHLFMKVNNTSRDFFQTLTLFLGRTVVKALSRFSPSVSRGEDPPGEVRDTTRDERQWPSCERSSLLLINSPGTAGRSSSPFSDSLKTYLTSAAKVTRDPRRPVSPLSARHCKIQTISAASYKSLDNEKQYSRESINDDWLLLKMKEQRSGA